MKDYKFFLSGTAARVQGTRIEWTIHVSRMLECGSNFAQPRLWSVTATFPVIRSIISESCDDYADANSLDSTQARRYHARRASLPDTGMSGLAHANLTWQGPEKSKSPNQTGSVNHASPCRIHLFCRF